MTEKTFFAGFGGQGIISLGEIWIFCGMKEGKNVSFFPFYGAEKRGGIARANCVVSDSAIASPIITRATSVVVMSQDSLAAGAATVAEGGLLLINTSLVTVDEATKRALPAGVRIEGVAASEIAERLGNLKIANMVMLGALAKKTGALSLANVEEILKGFFPESKHKFIPSNVAAIREGLSA
jgi:2-oxoglutarate ferredoxin oxidoreductase subunit gamma